MMFTMNSRLQIKIIPLKQDLFIDCDKAKYLHTSQIQNLNLDFKCYGFSGELQFNIPYNSDDESLWNDLFNNQNKFAVEIAYQEDKLENDKYTPNTNNIWSIRAYVDLNHPNAIELTDQVKDVTNSKNSIHYLSCKFHLIDAFNFIAKQHYPVKVFTRTTYKNIFESVFKNFSSLLKLEIDNRVDIFDEKYNWVCINCTYEKRSFYDLFFYTLKHYQLQLSYDYSNLRPSYVVQNHTRQKDKCKYAYLFNENIQKVTKRIGGFKFSNVKLINHHWTTKEKSDYVNLKVSDDKVLVSRDSISSYPVASQFKNAQYYHKNQIKNDSKMDCLILALRYFPSESSIQPGNQFIFSDKYKKKYSSYNKGLSIFSSSISFNKCNKDVIYAGQTSQLNITAKDKDISGGDYALDHGINITTKVYPIDQCPLSYPDFNKTVEKLHIYGWIDDLNDSGKDNAYFVTAGDKYSSKDISSDYEAHDSSSSPIDDNSFKELSYVVKLAPTLSGSSEKSLYITLPYFILNDHQVMPLRKDTAVAITLNQEHGSIVKIMWHSMQDKIFNKDFQINKLTLGANDSAGIIHRAETQKIKEGSLEIFAKNSKNKTQFISDKDQMSLVYSEGEKS
jgi:hypothetical protein